MAGWDDGEGVEHDDDELRGVWAGWNLDWVALNGTNMDGRVDGWMDGWVDGWWMGGWVDGWMDGWMDGWAGGRGPF